MRVGDGAVPAPDSLLLVPVARTRVIDHPVGTARLDVDAVMLMCCLFLVVEYAG